MAPGSCRKAIFRGRQRALAALLACAAALAPAFAMHDASRAAPRNSSSAAAASGIDRVKVMRTASGNLIRLSFRVLQPDKAALGDRNARAALLVERSGALLQVPVAEKVGPLDHAGRPRAGAEYWLVFANERNRIRQGDRVNVRIGSFRAAGVVVE